MSHSIDLYAVRDKLLREAQRNFEEARALTDPPLAPPNTPPDPTITMLNLAQAQLKSVAGDLLRSLAVAIDEGLRGK